MIEPLVNRAGMMGTQAVWFFMLLVQESGLLQMKVRTVGLGDEA